MIDTLEYSQELIAVGFTPEQAEVQAKALNKAVEKGTATKEDIALVRADINRIEGDLKLVKWMLALVIIVEVLPYLKTFLGG